METVVNDIFTGHFLRVDRSPSGDLVLATRKQLNGQYITYKNMKAIGWYSKEYLALSYHQLFFEVNFGGIGKGHSKFGQ